MYSTKEIILAVVEYMKSLGLTNVRHSVSKANIVLKVAQKLNVNESQVDTIFDNLIKMGKIRSSYNKYNENGKLVGYSISATTEEKFYLNITD